MFVTLIIFHLSSMLQLSGPMLARIQILQTREWSFVDLWLDLVETIKFYVDTCWNVMLKVLIAVSDNDLSENVEETRPRIDPVRRTRRLNNAMPELEETAAEGENSDESEPSMVSAEIEPSFLDTKDYPTGWLIYDPILGIRRQEEVVANGAVTDNKVD